MKKINAFILLVALVMSISFIPNQQAVGGGPDECCLNGYKDWPTGDEYGAFDCNCNNFTTKSRTNSTDCACPE